MIYTTLNVTSCDAICGFEQFFLFSITEAKYDAQNTTGFDKPSSQSNGKTNKNVTGINAYEEIVDVPMYSKPFSTSNPLFLQNEKVKHSSVSSKKSISSQKSLENVQESSSPHALFDEKCDHNANKLSDSESHKHSSSENASDYRQGKHKNIHYY